MRHWTGLLGEARVWRNWPHRAFVTGNCMPGLPSAARPLRGSYDNENSRGHGELDGSRLPGGLVSKRIAGTSSAELVRPALQHGGGEFELLRGAGSSRRGKLVPPNARWIHLRFQTAQAPLTALHENPTFASRAAQNGQNQG